MHFNYGASTTTFMKLCVEARILKEIPNHPNIIFLLHDFNSKPTHEIISACIQKKEDQQLLMKFNAISRKNEYNTSLFLIYKNYSSNLHRWSLEKRKDCQMIDLIRICYEISCGVLHLWNHGVVHRDLKLNNILIDDEGHILIIDFGVAVKLDANGKAKVEKYGGNPAHIAPEILNSDFPGEVDYSKQPSFALGVLFHEIIMGSHPFDSYPLGNFGNKPNICVPALNTKNMKQITNPVIDEKLISLICDLVCSSSSDRMSLQDSNNILKTLFRQYSHCHDLLIYNSYSDLQLQSKQKIEQENFDVNFTDICTYLGECYLNGRGTEQDEPQAFKYFKLSSAQNHSDVVMFILCNQYYQAYNSYSILEADIPFETINFDRSSTRDLEKLVGFILSSGVLLRQYLKFPERHVMNIKKGLEQLEKFFQFVHGISEKNERLFLQIWYHPFKIFNMLTNFKPSSNSNSYLSMNFKNNASYGKEDEQYYTQGRIVFVDSDKQFSFQKTDQSISMGIICGSQISKNIFPICIFGSCLVRVFVPNQIQSIDKRGMFVILNKNTDETNKENIGTGEIISFGEMITRESNSYDIVGICALGKLKGSESKSLYLYSSFGKNEERIPFPITNEIHDEEICFVLMISLPMSKFLLNLFVPTLEIKSTKIKTTDIGENIPSENLQTYKLKNQFYGLSENTYNSNFFFLCSGKDSNNCHDAS